MTIFLLSCILLYLIVSVSMLMHIKVENFQCNYVVTSYGFCQTTGDRFKFLQEHSIQDCVIECALRPHCGALSFTQNINLCQLFLSDDGDKIRAGRCVHVKRSDIQLYRFHVTAGTVSMEKDVTDYRKAVELQSNAQKGIVKCISIQIWYQLEYINQTTPNNGQVFGNLRDIGSTVRYKCNRGYKERKGITSAMCLKNGTMSHTAECVRGEVVNGSTANV